MKDFNEEYAKLRVCGRLLSSLKNKDKVIGELWEIDDDSLMIVDTQTQRIIDPKISKSNDPEFYERFVDYWKAYSEKNIQDFTVFKKLNTITIMEVQ